ncbi:LYR motif-containing protein 4 [Seminavis robusta]|uniref:LYR motif-containing protein 4 n=1 Tax=Seminavis robusta TaxID=568900 RepID=A0A9N8HYB8_9STRA|nr:LYR motif-containing protein 4 [Seminavis robusta]|eukprot:Sro1967_g308360.1 LYR motif-containing protein 4 (83) ;mRNA; r:13307-13634
MTNSAAISLFRSLAREAKHLNDYNFRSYAVRRVKVGFQKSRELQGEEAAAAMKYGQEQLKILKRQVILGDLYPSGRSVMESA